MFIGELHKRFVLAFEPWPWPLAALSLDIDDEAKRSIVASFYACNRCCLDDFSLWLRGHCETEEAFLSPMHLDFMKKVFQNVPASNIHSENRSIIVLSLSLHI